MKRQISLYVKDILENMIKAENFIKNMTYEEFLNDEKTSYAVVRCLEIIGEATKNIPFAVRRKYPEIPWQKMAGMRDKVIHIYFGLKIERIWLAVKKDIPSLKPLIEKVLTELPPSFPLSKEEQRGDE
jgi:uncharacterized protein with HEPN domain